MKMLGWTLSVLVTLSLLSSCGGSGSDSEIADPQQPNGNLPTGLGLNGGLTGRIVTSFRDIVADRDRPVQFDLFTGQYTELPMDIIQDELVRNGQNNNDFFETIESFFGAISSSSTRYVQTVPRCIRRTSEIAEFDSCVAIYGDDLQRQTQFRIVGYELNWPAKLSPSGRYLAMHEHFFVVGPNDSSTFLLFDVVENTQIGRYAVDIQTTEQDLGAGDAPLAWTPNDELVYTQPSDQRVIVYITQPGSLEVARTIRLPEIYQGEAVSLDVSPDGTKVLIGYEPLDILGEFNRSGVLLLDLETLTVSVPAVSESDPTTVPLGDNIEGDVRAPIWSPDGQWILVVEGTRVGAGRLSTQEYLFAIPANRERTLLTMDSPTEAILITLEQPLGPGIFVNDWKAGNAFYEASFDWIP